MIGQSDPHRYIVQKYGGTSIGTAARIRSAAENVARTLQAGDGGVAVAVVLSAMSSHLKTSGTTSRLLEAAAAAVRSGPSDHARIIDSIAAEHRDAIAGAIADGAIRAAVNHFVNAEFLRLTSFLDAVHTIGEVSSRSHDAIIGTGERLSCAVFAGALCDRGIPAVYVSLDRVVPDAFAAAADIDHAFFTAVRAAAASRVLTAVFSPPRQSSPADGHLVWRPPCAAAAAAAIAPPVAVVTGYFGYLPGGITASVGRGYSDFCAALLASGLGACELQIWKDVEGVFTADPQRVPRARPLPRLSPAEAAELSFFGAQVIHPFAMEQAIRASIPIRIKSILQPSRPGTLIAPLSTLVADNATAYNATVDNTTAYNTTADNTTAYNATAYNVATVDAEGKGSAAAAVTAKSSVTIINVRSHRKSIAHGFLAHIFHVLSANHVIVDLIATSEVSVSMAVAEMSEGTLKAVTERLKAIAAVTVSHNMAIVSLVGAHMCHKVGFAAQFFAALADANVNIEMISQGASEINISCVIDGQCVDKALIAVHDRLVLPL